MSSRAGITDRGRVTADEAALVLRLAGEAAAADGADPLSEDVRLHLRYGGDPAARNLLAWRGGELAGFAHLGAVDPADPAPEHSAELVVHPGHRRRGLGLALLRSVVAGAGERPVRVWAHGDLPAAAALAAAAGFERVRELWQMRRSLDAPVAEPRLAAGLTLRSFIPGRDEDAWLGLNSRAFADHPEQGRWASDDLARREREPWFDPAGFFLAERGGKLVGFHWTKIHRDGPGMGEVYVVGVDPGERGTGLGRALTLAGLGHLRGRGVPEVMLYVDGSNAAAIRLYESLGFTRTATDAMYARGQATDRTPSTSSISSGVRG